MIERLNEAKSKKIELENFLKASSTESDAQEKQRLLDQVREDNIEIAGMERRISELEDTINKTRDKMAQYDHEQESGASMVLFNFSALSVLILNIIDCS